MCRTFAISVVIYLASVGAAAAADAEAVRFHATDSVSISATWYPPRLGPSPFVIVTAHDGWEDSRVWQPLVSEWSASGYGVLNLDFRGFGGSYIHVETDPYACTTTAPDYAAMPNDILGAIRFVRERVVDARVVVVGSGDGADLALLAASRDTSVLGVAELAPSLAYPGEDIAGIMESYGPRPLLIMTAIPWLGFERNIKNAMAIADSLGERGPDVEHSEYRTACGLNFTTLRMIPDVVPYLNTWLRKLSEFGDLSEFGNLAKVVEQSGSTVTNLPPEQAALSGPLSPPECVTISGADDFPIRASIYLPTSNGLPEKAILLVHGASGSQSAWSPYLDSFLDSGWTVVTVDMRGHGKSVRLGDQSSHWCQSWESVKDNMGPDLSHVADFVNERFGDIRLVAMGGSMGGNSTLLAAAENSAIDAVILLSSGLARPRFELVDVLNQYGPERPLLVISTEGDRESYEAGRRVAALRPQTTLRDIPQSCTHAEPLLGEAPDLLPFILRWLADTESVIRPQ